MRNARAHKLQWSGPTVHSSTVSVAFLDMPFPKSRTAKQLLWGLFEGTTHNGRKH